MEKGQTSEKRCTFCRLREGDVIWGRYEIFVSYSKHDSAKTDPFVESLRDRGYRVFYDKQSLMLGKGWKEDLKRGIRSSRVCILCWSENARNSEVVAYEYSHAEGLGKPILPWLLDGTPLPQMIEVQGVVVRDPLPAVDRFVPGLGMKLTLQRRLQAVTLFLLLMAGVFVFALLHRPTPKWQFTGRVIDAETKLPLSGVEVDAERHQFVTYTDNDGKYALDLPPPRPKYLHLVFAKVGYRGDEEVTVSSDRPFNIDLTRLDTRSSP